MTPQQIVGLAVRLFAAWVALAGLSAIGTYFAALSQPGTRDGAAFTLVVPALYFLLAFGLWFFPMAIAHRLVPKTRFDNVLSAQPLELARVGSALIGLWVLATSVPWMGAVLTRVLLFEAANTSYFRSMAADSKFYFVEDVLRIVVGVALVAGSARFAEWLVPLQARSASRMDTNEPPAT